jgi:hypothetical protein
MTARVLEHLVEREIVEQSEIAAVSACHECVRTFGRRLGDGAERLSFRPLGKVVGYAQG